MLNLPERSGYEELVQVIRRVRRRWRFRIALRGAAIVVALATLKPGA